MLDIFFQAGSPFLKPRERLGHVFIVVVVILKYNSHSVIVIPLMCTIHCLLYAYKIVQPLPPPSSRMLSSSPKETHQQPPPREHQAVLEALSSPWSTDRSPCDLREVPTSPWSLKALPAMTPCVDSGWTNCVLVTLP